MYAQNTRCVNVFAVCVSRNHTVSIFLSPPWGRDGGRGESLPKTTITSKRASKCTAHANAHAPRAAFCFGVRTGAHLGSHRFLLFPPRFRSVQCVSQSAPVFFLPHLALSFSLLCASPLPSTQLLGARLVRFRRAHTQHTASSRSEAAVKTENVPVTNAAIGSECAHAGLSLLSFFSLSPRSSLFCRSPGLVSSPGSGAARDSVFAPHT